MRVIVAPNKGLEYSLTEIHFVVPESNLILCKSHKKQSLQGTLLRAFMLLTKTNTNQWVMKPHPFIRCSKLIFCINFYKMWKQNLKLYITPKNITTAFNITPKTATSLKSNRKRLWEDYILGIDLLNRLPKVATKWR